MAVFAMVQPNENQEGKQFTIQQIKTAHAKVKSGADFPNYIKELKKLGVIAYVHYVSNGQIEYHGVNSFKISADAKWSVKEITKETDIEKLKQNLKIHQAGKTDYFTFCEQAATIGVQKWIVEIQKMTCTYYNLKGNEMLVEIIPNTK